jgi:outer membrane receptor protein involved in Fe transport
VRALLCICLLLACQPRVAEAQAPQRFDFDLPAAGLELALQRFNAQSGAAAGMAGALPAIRTQPVLGRFTALEALQRMLAGSGLAAVPVGPLSYRLQRVAAAPPGDAPLAELAEVVVTANKRSQYLLDLPVPITVVTADQLASAGPPGGTRAALDFDASTSSTNLGPGRNRHFIRGLADSAFLGPSQATVSMQFDEVRLNYSAPDPDLHLIDVERVEILKGPQGPLYGTGALGGVVHILPQRPDLAARTLRVAALAGDTAHGGFSSGGSMVLNLPLARDSIGLRAVAYAQRDAGWIDNAGARSDANGTHLGGGRLALRMRPAPGWLLDLQGVVQDERVSDSQYVPGAAARLARSGVLPEPRDNDLRIGSAVLHGGLWGGQLVFSSSFVRHEASGMQDASAAAAAFGVTAPTLYSDDRDYRLLANELRFSAAGPRLSWLAGVAQLRADTRVAGRLEPAPATGATVLDLRPLTNELAAFGEADLAMSEHWRLTTGLRLTRAQERDRLRGMEQSGEEDDDGQRNSTVNSATPSMALDWHSADRRRIAYVRVARALRPGGLNPDSADDDDQRRFLADDLTSLDVGVRVAGDALALQAAAFATRWRHVQSDYLQANGLIGTRNVGNASNFGIELQLRWSAAGGWRSELGAVLQRARLDDPVVPAAGEDARLPVVPDARLYALIAREFAVGGWQARLQLRGEHSGASRLSFDADLDRDTPATFLLGAGASFTHGPWELQLTAANLLDSRADTFAFGNPFSIRDGPQRTPRRPRTLTLQLARSW